MPALILRTGQGVDQTKWQHQAYQSLRGIELLVEGLIFGWMRGNFAAFANFPLWLSWIFFGRGHYAAARKCCIVALVVSLATFQLLFQGWWFDEGASRVGYLAAPHIGYFCWIGSMALIAIGSQGSLEVVFKPGESSL